MTLNKKTITSIAVIMVLGSAGMAYAATSFFGEDCSVYAPETGVSKTCYDLNFLNERVHDLTNRVVALEALINPEPEPVPEPTELTIELDPSSVIAGGNFTASGVVPYVEGFDVVYLEILHPVNATIVYDSTPLVDLDGSYSDVIITGGEAWSVSANYTVTVVYNAESVEALLDYTTP